MRLPCSWRALDQGHPALTQTPLQGGGLVWVQTLEVFDRNLIVLVDVFFVDQKSRKTFWLGVQIDQGANLSIEAGEVAEEINSDFLDSSGLVVVSDSDRRVRLHGHLACVVRDTQSKNLLIIGGVEDEHHETDVTLYVIYEFLLV